MSSTLSDAELSGKLRALGVDVGPITDTTRKVYLNKLQSLTSKSPPSTSKPKSDEGQKSDVRPITPPLPAPPPPPILPPVSQNSTQIVEQLVASFDNPSHVASDTAFLFPGGEVVLASRAILSTQCNKMIPLLYNAQMPYSVNVATLSGQMLEFLIREEELVQDLKEKICMSKGIPVLQQRLIFQQQEMPDTSTFGSCGVSLGSTLQLILLTLEMTPPAISYLCPAMNPTLSLYHFKIGLGLEQVLGMQLSPQQQQQQCISLPSHITHIVHIHDAHYDGFKLFLRYLYCRKLQQLQPAGSQTGTHLVGIHLVCYVLGEYFQLPLLVEDCLSVISSHLQVDTANLLLQYAETIHSQALKEVCLQHLNTLSHPRS